MKVKDLIAKLMEYDPDMEVHTMVWDDLEFRKAVANWKGTEEGQAWDDSEFYEGMGQADPVKWAVHYGAGDRLRHFDYLRSRAGSGIDPLPVQVILDDTIIRDSKHLIRK